MRAEVSQVALAQYELLVSYLKIFLINASRIKLRQTLIKKNQTVKEPRTLQALRDAIDTHFRTVHTPSGYASLLNLSVKSLNRVVKKHFGKTLTHVISERIVIEAKKELYLSAKPVKAIAAERRTTGTP